VLLFQSLTTFPNKTKIKPGACKSINQSSQTPPEKYNPNPISPKISGINARTLKKTTRLNQPPAFLFRLAPLHAQKLGWQDNNVVRVQEGRMECCITYIFFSLSLFLIIKTLIISRDYLLYF
jgi:hypothetical protein